MIRKVNEATILLLEQREGCSLDAYLDQAGVATIGYGHTNNVKIGDVCTQQQAELWLDQDLSIAEYAVANSVSVPLTDNQFGALVMFAFNVGVGNFERSSLLKLLNGGAYASVPDQLKLWNKCSDPKTGILVTSIGLARRRAAEIKLWNTP